MNDAAVLLVGLAKILLVALAVITLAAIVAMLIGFAWRLITKLFVVFLLFVPLSVLAPQPKLKKTPVRLESPRGAEMARSLAIVPSQPTYVLIWSYPMPIPRQAVTFDVEWQPGFDAPWITIGTTNQPPFPVTTDGLKGFYRVKARRI